MTAATGLLLVVDDEEMNRDMLSRRLEVEGYSVLTAASGAEALERCRSLGPDVVLLDIGLPQANGFEVAKWLRGEECGKDAILVALTGWSGDEERRLAAEAGFNHYLVKPVPMTELEKIVFG